MKFTTTALISSLASLAMAAPTLSSRSTSTESTPPCNNNFQLQTKSSDAAFDGLFVEAYHTGAGFNDLVLTPGSGVSFSLTNDSQIAATLGGTMYEWVMPIDNNYAAWSSTQFNIETPNASYSIFSFDESNGNSLQFSNDAMYPDANSFKSWLGCNWWHGTPQLFWLLNGYDVPITANCAEMDIYPVCSS